MKLKIKLDTYKTRIDLALLQSLKKDFPMLTRALLKKGFEDKKILCNGFEIKKNQILSSGSYSIEVSSNWLDEVTSIKALPSKKGSFLPIVFEDKSLLILNKETGIPSVPHSIFETQTAVGSALAHYPELKDIGEKKLEPGLIHRLDTGTSGLLIFAKTQKEYLRLKKLWKEKKVKKIYRALSHAKNKKPYLSINKTPFKINFPLAHDLKSKKKMIALKNPHTLYRSKKFPAFTQILKFHLCKTKNESLSLIDFTLEIKTGVMHQIRCHLASLGYPVYGDPIYKGEPSKRLWLHAWKLEFFLDSGEYLRVQAPLPKGWSQSL